MVTEPDSGNETAISIAAHEPLPPAADVVARERTERPGFIQRNSLLLSGVLNLVGDGAMLWTGIRGKKNGNIPPNKYRAWGGGFYTLGGLNLTLFGQVKPEDKLKETKKDIAEFLQEKTGHTLKGTSLGDTASDVTPKGFFQRNTAQNTLYLYTLGAIALLFDGIKTFREDRRQWGGMVYGALSTLFKTTSLLIPEKATKKGEEKKGGFIEWIREKPLRVFGYGSMMTDTAYGIQTYQKYRKNPLDKDVPWDMTTTVTYLLSDFLMAQSNKDPANASGRLSAGDQRKIESLAADSIVQQPKDTRAELIRQVSEFLAKQPQVQGSADDIAKSISMQVAQLSAGKPWVTRAMENSLPTLSR